MAAIYQTGIDVSRYQGTIDWAAVARAGKQFAVIRAVSSNNSGVYVDPMFEKNYAGAKAAGLRVGVYYYTYAQTESYADRELEALTAVLAGKKLEYPVFVGRGHRRTGPGEGDAACALRTGKTACGGVVSGPVHLFQFCEKPAGYGEAQCLSVFCGGLHGQRYLSGRLPDVAVFQHRACTGYIGQCGPGPFVCGFSAGHSGGRLQWL